MKWVIVVSVLLGIGATYSGAKLIQRGRRPPRDPPVPPARTANAGHAARARAWIKQLLFGRPLEAGPMQATPRRATVYRRKRLFMLHAESLSTAGMWVRGKPVLSLEDTSDDRELGLALRTALAGSRAGMRHPRRWKRQTAPLLRLAGVKSWVLFAKSAVCANVHEEGERIVLVPTWSSGPKEGFVEDPSRKLVLERATPEELGAALRHAMS